MLLMTGNDELLMKDFLDQGIETLTNCGVKDIQAKKTGTGLPEGIYMKWRVPDGKDPKTSMLNKWNQLHQCKNVFVTDGAC